MIDYLWTFKKVGLIILLALGGSGCNAQEGNAQINELKNELDRHPQLVLNAARELNATNELSTKRVVIANDQQQKITLDIPEGVTLAESGALKSEAFGEIRVGTLAAHSIVYEIEHDDYNYGFTPSEIWMTADADTFSYDALLEREPDMKSLTHADFAIWISTDSMAFSMDDYLAANPHLKVVESDGNRVVGYDIQFDPEKDAAFIHSLFSLTYYRVGQSHLFIYGKVTRSEVKNFPNVEVMNRFVNIFYLVSNNIRVHPPEKH